MIIFFILIIFLVIRIMHVLRTGSKCVAEYNFTLSMFEKNNKGI